MSDRAINIDERPEVVVYTGRVRVGEGGELVPVQACRKAWAAKLVPEAGRLVDVTVTRERLRRSPAANRHLWGWVYPHILAAYRTKATEAGEACMIDVQARALRAAGYKLPGGHPVTPRGLIHERMVRRFLPELNAPEMVSAGELGRVEVSRTRELSPEEFHDFSEQIAAWAAGEPLYLTICPTRDEDGGPVGHVDGCPLAMVAA